MKKSIFFFAAFFSAALISCASTKISDNDAYVFSEENGDILYTFEASDEDSINDTMAVRIPPKGAGSFGYENEAYPGALYLDGQNNWIILDKKILDGDGFTLSIDVNPERWEFWQRIYDIGNGGDCDMWLGLDQTTKALRFSCGDVTCLAPLPETGKWTTVTTVFGKGRTYLYINGKLSQSVICSLTTARLKETVKGLYIGKSNWNDPLFKGAVDNLFISGKALSEKEVAGLSKTIPKH